MNGDLKKQYSDIRECLTDILRNRGKNFFKNGNQLVALLRDLMPANKGELNMIRQMTENGILSDFVSADAKGQSDKERAVYSAIQTLVDVMFIDEDKARQYVIMLAEVFGWNAYIQKRQKEYDAQEKLACGTQGEAERKIQKEEDHRVREDAERRARYPQMQRKFLQSKEDSLKQMATATLEYGGVVTTFIQAKEIQPVVEKLVDLGKEGDIGAYRKAIRFITKEDVSRKLFKEIASKYSRRNGSYTRITRMGSNRDDASEMAIIELI